MFNSANQILQSIQQGRMLIGFGRSKHLTFSLALALAGPLANNRELQETELAPVQQRSKGL